MAIQVDAARASDSLWSQGNEPARTPPGRRSPTARATPPCDALDEIDLSVDEGHLVAVMGPCGSGKSTLLTIAGSLEEPTTGEVVIEGASLHAMSRNDKARLRRRTIGYVFQDFNLLAGLTAVENVALPLELDGVSAVRRTPRHGRARESSASPIGQGTIPTSSRAASASGSPSPAPWSANARLLLADEPSGALDSKNGEAVMQLIVDGLQARRRRRRGHPRRPPRLLGGPRRFPPRRPRRRPLEPDAADSSRRTRSSASRVGPKRSIDEHCRSRAAREARPPDGGVPARRAVVRWAWRLFRREWRQQFLILALIVVAVAATIVGSAVATNNPPPKNSGFGTAQDSATFTSSTRRPASDIAKLEHRFGRVEVIENQTMSIPGSINTYQLRAQDPARAIRRSDALARLRALPGRAPTRSP